jgi:hypothetical protein
MSSGVEGVTHQISTSWVSPSPTRIPVLMNISGSSGGF